MHFDLPTRSGTDSPSLAIVLCSYYSDLGLLEHVLSSIAAQTAIDKVHEVILVDNHPARRLSYAFVSAILQQSVRFRILHEPRPGVFYARCLAFRGLTVDWILQVDDDNVIPPNYIETGLKIIGTNENLGAFGGRILLPDGIAVPRWANQFLEYLAIKDVGQHAITKCSREWGLWEPPGAGAFCHVSLVRLLLLRLTYFEQGIEIGRIGNRLLSGEDSVLFQGSGDLARVNGYFPQLAFTHHISPKRIRVSYVMRLARGYGRTHARQEWIRRSVDSFESEWAQDRPLIGPPVKPVIRVMSFDGVRFLQDFIGEVAFGFRSGFLKGIFMLNHRLGWWCETYQFRLF